jgi:hypothetical protein
LNASLMHCCRRFWVCLVQRPQQLLPISLGLGCVWAGRRPGCRCGGCRPLPAMPRCPSAAPRLRALSRRHSPAPVKEKKKSETIPGLSSPTLAGPRRTGPPATTQQPRVAGPRPNERRPALPLTMRNRQRSETGDWRSELSATCSHAGCRRGPCRTESCAPCRDFVMLSCHPQTRVPDRPLILGVLH